MARAVGILWPPGNQTHQMSDTDKQKSVAMKALGEIDQKVLFVQSGCGLLK